MKINEKNLRLFFGTGAVQIWSLWRDRQRALKSAELYNCVIEELQQDLAKESENRGSLVNQRSLVVTEVREKLLTKETERSGVRSQLLETESYLDGFMKRLEVRFKALFFNQPGIDELEEKQRQYAVDLERLQVHKEKLKKELGEVIYRQKAAIDPIEDLEFAIAHLQQKVIDCRKRAASVNEQISDKLAERCRSGSPFQLQLLLQSGLELDDEEQFCGLYFKIHDLSRSLIGTFAASQPMTRLDFSKTLDSALQDVVLRCDSRVSMNGRGSHHRKVKSGKSSSWRRFDITFSGSVSCDFSFPQKRFKAAKAAKAIYNRAACSFLEARESALLKFDKARQKEYENLRESASQLWVLGFLV